MTRELEFTKMHGIGNDFVVLDGIAQELPPLEPLARRLADRGREMATAAAVVILSALVSSTIVASRSFSTCDATKIVRMGKQLALVGPHFMMS